MRRSSRRSLKRPGAFLLPALTLGLIPLGCQPPDPGADVEPVRPEISEAADAREQRLSVPPPVDPATVPTDLVRWLDDLLGTRTRSEDPDAESRCEGLVATATAGGSEASHQAAAALPAALQAAYDDQSAYCVAEVHNALGILAAREHDLSAAFDHYAASRYVASGHQRVGAWLAAHLNLATLHFRMGRLDEALAMIEQGMPALDALGDEVLWRKAAALNVKGRILLAQSRRSEAIETLHQGLNVRRRLEADRPEGRRSYLVPGLNALGRAYLDAGRLDEALPVLQQVVELTAGTGLDRAHALNEMADYHLLRGETEAAAACLEQVASLSAQHEIDDTSLLLQAEYLRARVHLARHQPQKAIASLYVVVAGFETLRLRESADLFAPFFAQRRVYLDLLIRLLVADARVDEAFEVAEWARARGLVDAILWPPAAIEKQATQAQVARAGALRRRLAALAHGSGDQQAAEREILAVRDALLDVEADMRREAGALAARPVDLATARGLLAADEVLLAYWLGEEVGSLWIVSGGDAELRHVELKDPSTLAKASETVREHLAAGSVGRGVERELRALSVALLAPAGDELAKARHLVLVADGALDSLPFTLLDDPAAPAAGVPLARRLSLSHVHSLSVLAALRSRQLASGPEEARHSLMLTAFADPQYSDPGSKTRPPLPANRVAARQLADLARTVNPLPTRLYLGAEASRDAILAGAASSSRFVHFGAHVELDPALPDLSAIHLAELDPAGASVDGALRLHDLRRLDLSVQVVTLAGCSTAIGRSVGLEGPMAFPRGFLYAGASTVVASLWQVHDVPTAELMRAFYDQLLVGRQSPAEALRRAQLQLLDGDWPEPRHWAGFVLLGEWLNPAPSSPDQPLHPARVYRERGR